MPSGTTPSLPRGQRDAARSGEHRMSLARATNQANIAAPVRARLLNLAKTQGVDFNQVLARAGAHPRPPDPIAARGSFSAQGRAPVYPRYDMPHRATRDADLLGFGASGLASVAETLRDVAGLPRSPTHRLTTSPSSRRVRYCSTARLSHGRDFGRVWPRKSVKIQDV